MASKILQTSFILAFLCIANILSAQNKLTRNQIINAVRNHANTDTTDISLNNAVNCDSTTSKITLEVSNDTITEGHSYLLTFTKKEIELVIFDKDYNLYKSAFEYEKSSYENLKETINKKKLKKVDSYNDSILSSENDILKLYKGNTAYISVESYNHRTNVTEGFHELVSEIKKNMPRFANIIEYYKTTDIENDSLSSDTIKASIIPSMDSVNFKRKGGEFQKIKISCNEKEWEILSYPTWVIISQNSNNEIVLESTRNDTKKHRMGTIKVGCYGEIREIFILQN